eukprot:scaffold694_cov338-Pavlova_lutheri.AAC.40
MGGKPLHPLGYDAQGLPPGGTCGDACSSRYRGTLCLGATSSRAAVLLITWYPVRIVHIHQAERVAKCSKR